VRTRFKLPVRQMSLNFCFAILSHRKLEGKETCHQ
jgi:hypothetical protein